MANGKPYNSKFCKFVDCVFRSGNKCLSKECIYNHKWILHWEINGVYPPEGVNYARPNNIPNRKNE